MGKFTALSIAGAMTASIVSAAAISAASAADLPPPPALEPAPYAAPVAQAEFGGWYLRGDIGIGMNRNLKLNVAPDPLKGTLSGLPVTDYQFFNEDLGSSGIIGIGVGYQYNSWLRFDVTGEYRGGGKLSAVDQVSANGSFNNTNAFVGQLGATPAQAALRNFYSGHVSSWVAMFNGYVDLGSWYGLTPYVGAGVGFARNTVSGLTDTGFNYNTVNYIATTDPFGNAVAASSQSNGFPTGGYWSPGSKTNFAWALMAGVGYNVTQNLKLEFGYRYLNLGTVKSGQSNCFAATPGFAACDFKVSSKRLDAHDLRIGMRWMLQDAPVLAQPVYAQQAPLAERPIIRKY